MILNEYLAVCLTPVQVVIQEDIKRDENLYYLHSGKIRIQRIQEHLPGFAGYVTSGIFWIVLRNGF